MPFKNKEDMKLAQKDWYRKNKEKIAEGQRERRKKLARQINEYKKGLKCERCPENDPVCLDFHHRDPKTKELKIAQAASAHWLFDRVLKEIEKCVVLCANCHRKEHAS